MRNDSIIIPRYNHNQYTTSCVYTLFHQSKVLRKSYWDEVGNKERIYSLLQLIMLLKLHFMVHFQRKALYSTCEPFQISITNS